MLIGVTGNIGAGKSQVSKMFEGLGAHRMDADKIVHEMYEPNSPLTKKIASTFGPNYIGQDGRVDRKALGELVFSNPSELQKLNDLTHPQVRKEVQDRVNTIYKEHGQEAIIVVEVALLLESDWASYYDQIILIVASKNTRERRLLRRGMSVERITQVMGLQRPAVSKVSQVHYVIDNDGTEEETQNQAHALWDELTSDLIEGA